MLGLILLLAAAGAKDVEECGAKQFGGETLGFVTPWHQSGKEVALRVKEKLDYVSPLWFHIEPAKVRGEVKQWTTKVTKVGNPDKAWVNNMQTGGVKVVPVFAFYGWRRSVMKEFFMNPASGTVQHNTVRNMINMCKEHDCDGLVLEWGPLPVKEFYYELSPWLKRLKGSMSKFFEKDFKLMLSVHPDPERFGKEEFESLAPHVDRFVMHLYNFTTPVLEEGPSAPMQWFTSMVKAWNLDTRRDADHLVIATINLHGREYVPGHALDVEAGDLTSDPPTRWDITGAQYQALKNSTDLTLTWDPDHQEHKGVYTSPTGEAHTVYFPTRKSVKIRIDFIAGCASKLGLGLWNLGAGLDDHFSLI